METYNAVKRISSKLNKTLISYIEMNETHKNCYFWTPGGKASERRNKEKQFSNSYPDFQINSKLGVVEVRPAYNESCRNVYYSMYITLDGVKKNISLLKKLVN